MNKTRRIVMILAVGLSAVLQAVAAVSGVELRRPGSAEKLGWESGDSVVVIPAQVRKLPGFIFAGAEGLKRVEFADGSQCVSVGEFAFAECPDLEEVRLPSGLKELGEGVFRNCRRLREVNIPEGMWALPKECFNGCEAMERVELPATIWEIGAFAFANCLKLRDMKFPPELREIGNNAFSRCFELEKVELPATVKLLDSYAFSDCVKLRGAVLPANGNRLGELIFSGCSSLEEIVEGSDVPPLFDCASYLFEPGDAAYGRCLLIVPARSVDSYRRYHCWRLFERIASQTPPLLSLQGDGGKSGCL